ncbi:hypothetical protein Sros_0254 [Streptosporangium roseum DSM 43021]|uniref:Uncharacterized protein n=1 Tax=Streptosporangium roseum (strain ATCC 12428 / DSM 43021 / JCM 3005 / KCTC 9067 / NCIMB 10171 / NRRL 2505 / NI 9100) TaxID=479432 RepID=D2AZA4_STRRD|nr:hypothetical protein Sros_0254 [Streptosporangium roseum DSM 43021]
MVGVRQWLRQPPAAQFPAIMWIDQPRFRTAPRQHTAVPGQRKHRGRRLLCPPQRPTVLQVEGGHGGVTTPATDDDRLRGSHDMPRKWRQPGTPHHSPCREIEAGQLIGVMRQNQATIAGDYDGAWPGSYRNVPADRAVVAIQADKPSMALMDDDAIFRHRHRRSGTPLMELSLPQCLPDHLPSSAGKCRSHQPRQELEVTSAEARKGEAPSGVGNRALAVHEAVTAAEPAHEDSRRVGHRSGTSPLDSQVQERALLGESLQSSRLAVSSAEGTGMSVSAPQPVRRASMTWKPSTLVPLTTNSVQVVWTLRTS